MNVDALLATLMVEREKLTRAIVALEGLRGTSPAQPITRVKPKTNRSPKSRTAWSRETKATIVAKMREAVSNGDSMTAVAKRFSAELGVPLMTISSNWRSWEKKANGITTPFTAAEIARAADVAQA